MLSKITHETTPMYGVVFSEYANLFPMIEGTASDDFKADIKDNGVTDAIVFLGNEILDGRNRYTIARELGISYPRCDYLGDDPAGFVISKNLKRRHLNDTQRAMIAAKFANLPIGRRPEISPAGGVSSEEAAGILGVSVRSVERAKVVLSSGEQNLKSSVMDGGISLTAAAEIATLSEAEQERIVRAADPKVFNKVVKEIRAAKQVEKKTKRVEREAELGSKQRALPDAKYGVIYADPAWAFETYSAETGMDRSADNHYPTTNIDDILTLPVFQIAADDCALFLWATAPMIKEALQVLVYWGFTYKSQYIWNKDSVGTGYWNRNKHEILLIATRGNVPAPAMGTQYPSVIDAPVGAHSAKPEIFAQMIEKYFPTLPKIELNRRGPARDGWSAWGLEAELEEIAA